MANHTSSMLTTPLGEKIQQPDVINTLMTTQQEQKHTFFSIDSLVGKNIEILILLCRAAIWYFLAFKRG